MKYLNKRFLLEEEGFEDDVADEPVEEQSTTLYKVSFQLGDHENWSKYEATSKDEAAKAVKDYITKKWPNRDFRIIDIEKYEEIEESITEDLNNVPRDFKVGDIVFVKPSKKMGRVIKVNGEYIDVEIMGGKYPDRIDTFYPGDLELKTDEEESLTEGLGEITDAQPIEAGPSVGMAIVISDLIKDEYEAIDGYNSAIATAQAEGFEDAVRVLTEIQAEENIHVGQLQEVMKLFDPNADKVEDGQAEGEEQLSNPEVNKVETITEDIDDLSDDEFIKFRDCIKDKLNMNWKDFIVAYEGHKLPIQDINSLEDIPGEYIELGNTDLSQGTGNVIVYTMLSLEDGQLYRYVSY